MLGQTQVIGSKFGIFGVFRWVHSLILVKKTGFSRVRSSVLMDLGQGLVRFLADQVQSSGFLEWFQKRLMFGFK